MSLRARPLVSPVEMAAARRGSVRAATPSHGAGDPFPSGYGAARQKDAAKRAGGSCMCRRAVRLLRLVGGGVAQALCCAHGARSSSGQVSPKSAASATLYPPPRDSHHAEAIEDCIRFINSSSRKSS